MIKLLVFYTGLALSVLVNDQVQIVGLVWLALEEIFLEWLKENYTRQLNVAGMNFQPQRRKILVLTGVFSI